MVQILRKMESMQPKPTPNTDESATDMNELRSELARIEKFFARRFDEISMEINATSQLVGMSEQGLETRFAEILGVLSAISYHGDGKTPHNAGVELDAVVKTTEEAANRILDSADQISTIVKSDVDWANADARQQALNNISGLTETILMACAFQDLTGQRIGRTLENIRKAEAELSDTLKKLGLKIDTAEALTQAALPSNFASSQDDIDSLFR